MMLFPVLKFWRYSPLQFAAVLLWNSSELLKVQCPFAGIVFGVIMGKQGKKAEKL